MPGLGIHADIVQHCLAVRIAEVNAFEHHAAAQQLISDAAIGPVRVLPGPDAGAPGTLAEGAVGVFAHVDELNAAAVALALLVQHGEDPLRPGAGHDDAADLLAYLRYGLREVLVQAEEGDQRAYAQAPAAAQGQQPAGDGAEDIAYVAQVGVDGHDYIGHPVCAVGALAQLFVEDAEALQALLLAAEAFDDFLPVDHLLNVAVDRAEVALLAREILSGAPAYPRGHGHHDRDHQA